MLTSVHADHGRMLPHCLAVVPVFLAAFSKVHSIPTVPIFIWKFLNKFLCSITFKNIQIFYQNSIFVAVTRVYTKVLSAV